MKIKDININMDEYYYTDYGVTFEITYDGCRHLVVTGSNAPLRYSVKEFVEAYELVDNEVPKYLPRYRKIREAAELCGFEMTDHLYI